MRGRGIDTPRLQKFFLLLFMYLSFFLSLSISLVCFRFVNEWTQLVLYERRRDKRFASSGNRTRAARVAGEHSTTEPTMLDGCQVTLYCKTSTRKAVVAEWLRRLTRNQFPSGSVGSNPTNCDSFWMMTDNSSVAVVGHQSPIPR